MKTSDYLRVAEELRDYGGRMAMDAADMVERLAKKKAIEAQERKKPWYRIAKRRGLL